MSGVGIGKVRSTSCSVGRGNVRFFRCGAKRQVVPVNRCEMVGRGSWDRFWGSVAGIVSGVASADGIGPMHSIQL